VNRRRALPASHASGAANPMERLSIAHDLLRQRRTLGLTQAELARRAGIR